MKIFSLPFVLVFFLTVAIVISCKKNDETDPCADFEKLGTFTKQKVSPTSQSTTDLNSGTLKVIDLTNKKYNIDLSAKLVGGGTVTFKGDVQF